MNAPPYALHEPQYDTPNFTRLSLAALAAWLRHNGYHDLLLTDAKYERIGYQEILDRIEAFRPDLVGYTAFTNEIIQCGHVARLVHDLARRTGQSILNLVGGVHCTALPEQRLRGFPEFDLVAVGGGEQILLELTEALDRGERIADFRNIHGLARSCASGTSIPFSTRSAG